MLLLVVDPGSRVTGFGVIRVAYDQCYYVASGCIRLKHVQAEQRLLQIQKNLYEIITQYQPDESAIEKVFMHHNPLSALKLGQARGVVMCSLASYDIPVSAYSAREIKQAIVGYGGAKKHQIQHMVQSMLGLTAKPQEDAADALAIAMCHFHTIQSQTNLSQLKQKRFQGK
jgi:crossover junction endodeoxyribonuclease RuvC